MKIGWKISRFWRNLPAFIALIMCGLWRNWKIWRIFSCN